MAEILVHKGGTHRWDRMTSEELQKEREESGDPEVWDRRYAARWQEGQVVEIREDGFWSGPDKYPRRDVFPGNRHPR